MTTIVSVPFNENYPKHRTSQFVDNCAYISLGNDVFKLQRDVTTGDIVLLETKQPAYLSEAIIDSKDRLIGGKICSGIGPLASLGCQMVCDGFSLP